MLQRLPIALAQVKAGNTYENLLNKIRQIIFSMYQAKEITKKVYNKIMNSIKSIIQKRILYLWILKIVKPLDPHRLLLNLTDNIDLRKKDCFIKS